MCGEIKDTNLFYAKKDRSSRASMCKECFNNYCITRWINRKIQYINHFGGACTRCGLRLENSHYSVFEFHHRNSLNKEYSWNKLRLFSDRRILLELNKCDLLCANCHRITHSELR